MTMNKGKQSLTDTSVSKEKIRACLLSRPAPERVEEGKMGTQLSPSEDIMKAYSPTCPVSLHP